VAVRDYFSAADLTAVKEATREAESRTSGEFVCVIVERSDGFEDARWRAAALGSLIGGLLAAYGFYALEAWEPAFFIWPAVMPFAGMAVGWLAAIAVPPIERELAGGEALRSRVHNRAAAAFVDESVFRTRDRTGILIFVSLFERRVEILCDEGVRDKVPGEAWLGITRVLAAALGDGRGGAALTAAIKACGDVVEEAGLERREDDVNELPDEPRVGDE